MIHFQQLRRPFQDNVGVAHWTVEFFDDESPVRMSPAGVAYVGAILAGGTCAYAQLNSLLIAEAYRRRGVDRRLVAACREKWPNLAFAPDLSPAHNHGPK